MSPRPSNQPGVDASKTTAFNLALRAIFLDTTLQTGSFTKVVPWQGNNAVYRFSLAVGWGYNLYCWKYKERLGQPPPPWVDLLHPTIARLACGVAVDFGIPLPDCLPADAERSIRAFIAK